MLYRCANCLAVCRQLVWEALGLSEAEERCPKCNLWSKFELCREGQSQAREPKRKAA